MFTLNTGKCIPWASVWRFNFESVGVFEALESARHAGFDPSPFLKVLAHVDGSAKIVAAEADALLTAYHAGLERFVAHVDAIVGRP